MIGYTLNNFITQMTISIADHGKNNNFKKVLNELIF